VFVDIKANYPTRAAPDHGENQSDTKKIAVSALEKVTQIDQRDATQILG